MDSQNPLSGQINAFADPFLASQALQGLDATQATINPYAEQAPSVGAQAFFQDTTSFRHPLNYHLYASLGPRRDQITQYQRATADFFIPDDLREDLQRNFVEGEEARSHNAEDQFSDGKLQMPGHGTGTLSILAGGKVSMLNGGFDDYIGLYDSIEIVPIRIAKSVVLFKT
ncbi:MAG: hypothetical protein EOO38_21610, partial [Cytophagaceae bacterium]